MPEATQPGTDGRHSSSRPPSPGRLSPAPQAAAGLTGVPPALRRPSGGYGRVSGWWAERARARPRRCGGAFRAPLGPRSPAVPGQAFVISFTSDFIPRLVYLYTYSADGTMHGFVNHTLSSFNVSDFQDGTAPSDPLDLGYEVQICRYRVWGDVPRLQPGFLRGQVAEQLNLVLERKK